MPSFDLFHSLRYWTDTPELVFEMEVADASRDRENSLSDRYAFQLGEALGTFRLSLPGDWSCAELERGYAHGLGQATRHANIYLRKLLTLRTNALARAITVSSAITTDYLRAITVTVCPVSGVELTQGANCESDWSVDRLDNSLGYVQGNLCIVSTRVNKYKGGQGIQALAAEAKALLSRDGPAAFVADLGNGLMVVEALRLAALMAGPSGFASGCLGMSAPFATAPGAIGTIDGAIAGLHVACARERVPGAGYVRRYGTFKELGKDVWRASNRLREHVRHALDQGKHPCDIWFGGQAITLLNELTEAHMSNPVGGGDSENLIGQYESAVCAVGSFRRD